MSAVVVEGCELTQILFKKFGYLERRVTYLEGKSRAQQELIEELQTKSASQENIIHELKEELKKKTTTSNQDLEGQASEEESEESVDVDVNPDVNLNELTEPIQNTQLIISEKVDKLSQSLVVHMGARLSETPQGLENTCENSAAEVEKDQKSKISQKCKTKSAHQKVKTVGQLSKPKRKGKNAHTCVFCSKSVQSFEELSRHMRVHTGERPYTCKICLKSYTQKVALKMHTRVHTTEKPFSCSVCSKSFAYKQVLKRHMRIHTGEKPYSCSVCPKTFADISSRKRHMMNHSGEKPYSCLVLSCPMTYSNPSALKYHMSLHFGTYVCSICSKRFGGKSLLEMHERVHAGERPFECTICKKKYFRKESLVLHKKKNLNCQQ